MSPESLNLSLRFTENENCTTRQSTAELTKNSAASSGWACSKAMLLSSSFFFIYSYTQNQKEASCHQQGLIENMTVDVTFQLVANQLEIRLQVKIIAFFGGLSLNSFVPAVDYLVGFAETPAQLQVISLS